MSGLVLSISNFLRDRPKVIVNLLWDMTILDNKQERKVGLITITNVGRRPIYFSHVSLKMPKEYKSGASYLLIKSGIAGEKLSEGDPPKTFVIEYDAEIKKVAAHWKGIRAQVSDSTGRVWLSKRNVIERKPSWV